MFIFTLELCFRSSRVKFHGQGIDENVEIGLREKKERFSRTVKPKIAEKRMSPLPYKNKYNIRSQNQHFYSNIHDFSYI